MSSKEDKEMEKELRAEVAALSDKVLNRRARAEELKKDIEHTRRDIASRDEQILLKTEQLMTCLQKIKSLDDEQSRLSRQLERHHLAKGAQRPQDKLQALMEAVNRKGTEGDLNGPGSAEDAIMRDIAKIARLTYQLTARVNITDNSPLGSKDSNHHRLGGSTRAGGELSDRAELDEVRVWYKKTSCIFKITDQHTFRKLLDEVIMYWSLEPSKNVLVNAQNFIWPLNASVREVIGSLPGGSHGSESIIKVWNRDFKEKVTFNSWILKEEKKEKHRKEEDMKRKLEYDVVHGSSISSGGKDEGGSKEHIGKASLSDWDHGDGSQHVPGMDVAKPSDQQIRMALSKGMKDGMGTHAGYGHPRLDYRSNGVDLCKYIELFIFILFITLFGNTLFMRRSVYRASILHHGFVSTLFDDAVVPKAPARPYTMHQGLSVGSQAVAPQGVYSFTDTEVLSFDEIRSGTQIWQWMEGPFRAAVTGLLNGTASIGLTEEQLATSDGAPDVLGNNTFLRHNVLMGRPRIVQWRVQETSLDVDCIKPGQYDLYGRQCLSQYQAGINQVKGIQVGDLVMRIDPSEQLTLPAGVRSAGMSSYRKINEKSYKVTAVHSSSYPGSVTYDLEGNGETNKGQIVTGVERAEISTTSFMGLQDLSYEQRVELYNATNGFLFDYASQAVYEKASSSLLGSLSTFITGNLEGGGFSTEVPVASEDAFDTHMSYLKRFAWIDEKTRAVEVAFNMYNANYDVVIATKALFELTPGGMVLPHHDVKIARLCDDWRAQDRTRMQIEFVCLLLAAVTYAGILITGLNACLSYESEDEMSGAHRASQKNRKKNKKKRQASLATYLSENFGELPARCGSCFGELSRFWNIVEFLLICALALDFWMRRDYHAIIPALSSSDLFGGKYTDLSIAISRYNGSINLSSLVMFLSMSKCFKYFQLNPSVSLSWRVLQRSAVSFISYSFIFLVFMSGFTVTGYALFGPKLSDFLSMQRTSVQLFRMVVGGFEYEKLADSNPFLAPIYFLAVAILGYFILRNLFIAIINAEFTKAANDVRENGFHWLVKDKSAERSISRVLRGVSSGGREGEKMSRTFPGNRIGYQ